MQMSHEMLIELLNSRSYNRSRAITWVSQLSKDFIHEHEPTIERKIRDLIPSNFKKGDVFFHYGLNHPVVLLKRLKDDEWLVVLLSTTFREETILEKCRSRFFNSSYFTKTLTNFMIEEHSFYWGYFDNVKQVNEVKKKLFDLYD